MRTVKKMCQNLAIGVSWFLPAKFPIERRIFARFLQNFCWLSEGVIEQRTKTVVACVNFWKGWGMSSVCANFHSQILSGNCISWWFCMMCFLGLVWSPPQLSLSSLTQTNGPKSQPSEKLDFTRQGVKWRDGEVVSVSQDIVFPKRRPRFWSAWATPNKEKWHSASVFPRLLMLVGRFLTFACVYEKRFISHTRARARAHTHTHTHTQSVSFPFSLLFFALCTGPGAHCVILSESTPVSMHGACSYILEVSPV